MLDAQWTNPVAKIRHGGQGYQPCRSWQSDGRKGSDVCLELPGQVQNDLILIGRGIDGPDLGTPKGKIQRLLNGLGGNAQGRRTLVGNVHIDFGIGHLQGAIHRLKTGGLAQGLHKFGNCGIQRLLIFTLEDILIIGLGGDGPYLDGGRQHKACLNASKVSHRSAQLGNDHIPAGSLAGGFEPDHQSPRITGTKRPSPLSSTG